MIDVGGGYDEEEVGIMQWNWNVEWWNNKQKESIAKGQQPVMRTSTDHICHSTYNASLRMAAGAQQPCAV